MSPALELALFVILALMLAVVSAAAGALWRQARSHPRVVLADLVRDLTERQRALDGVLARLEARTQAPPSPAESSGPRPIAAARPAAALRFDRGADEPVSGPTLIAVPDLSAPAPEPSPASAELGRRFGAIWDLADAGESADSVARRTGYPIGQVELILGLRRQLAAAEARA